MKNESFRISVIATIIQHDDQVLNAISNHFGSSKMAFSLPRAPKRYCRGSKFGSLTILDEITSGKFAAVFSCASDKGEKFALKEIRGSHSTAVGELLCVKEKLSNVHLVNLLETFSSQHGTLCFLMPYMRGCELFEMAGEIDASSALRITIGLSKAIRYLHRHQLVHRDCKPENVIVDEHAEAVLVDLGTVRAHGVTAMVHGTRAYLPPEEKGRKTHVVVPSLDAWSLGITICSVLLGEFVKSCADATQKASRRPHVAALICKAAVLLVRDVTDRRTVPQFLNELTDFESQ